MKVCIERDEQGQFSVGVDTADQEGQSIGSLMQPEQMPMQGQAPEAEEDAGMQPATDIDDALNQARALLAGPQTEQQAFAQA